MSTREILIQDLGNEREIERFREYYIYRRDITQGEPLYFAPHFTQSSNQNEGVGISYIAKVLGTLDIVNVDKRPDVSAKLARFTDDKALIEKWQSGIYLPGANHPGNATYYFLDKPLKFKTPLQKDNVSEQSPGWIAAMIPPNRTVSFIDFLRNMPSQK